MQGGERMQGGEPVQGRLEQAPQRPTQCQLSCRSLEGARLPTAPVCGAWRLRVQSVLLECAWEARSDLFLRGRLSSGGWSQHF